MTDTPERKARRIIDTNLEAAGWLVQSHDEVDLAAGSGIAVREFPMKPGFGTADYVLYVDRMAIGAIEAKPGGTLTGVEEQSGKYAVGLPDDLPAHHRPLPFVFESNGARTAFTNGLDPAPRSRHVFNFPRPETLVEWSALPEQVRARLRALPRLDDSRLWSVQSRALRNLEKSLGRSDQRALIQNLVMQYGHDEAVIDGVNVDFDVYRIRTKVTEQGSTIEADGTGVYVEKRNKLTRRERLERLEDDLTYTANQLDRSREPRARGAHPGLHPRSLPGGDAEALPGLADGTRRRQRVHGGAAGVARSHGRTHRHQPRHRASLEDFQTGWFGDVAEQQGCSVSVQVKTGASCDARSMRGMCWSRTTPWISSA